MKKLFFMVLMAYGFQVHAASTAGERASTVEGYVLTKKSRAVRVLTKKHAQSVLGLANKSLSACVANRTLDSFEKRLGKQEDKGDTPWRWVGVYEGEVLKAVVQLGWQPIMPWYNFEKPGHKDIVTAFSKWTDQPDLLQLNTPEMVGKWKGRKEEGSENPFSGIKRGILAFMPILDESLSQDQNVELIQCVVNYVKDNIRTALPDDTTPSVLSTVVKTEEDMRYIRQVLEAAGFSIDESDFWKFLWDGEGKESRHMASMKLAPQESKESKK